MTDNVQEQGERSRQRVLASLRDAGLDEEEVGRRIAGVLNDADADPETKRKTLADVLRLMAAMPSQHMKVDVRSEQRMLQLTVGDGQLSHNGTFALSQERLLRLPPEERRVALKLLGGLSDGEDATDQHQLHADGGVPEQHGRAVERGSGCVDQRSAGNGDADGDERQPE